MGWKEISTIRATGKIINAYKYISIDIGFYFSLCDVAQLNSRMKQNGTARIPKMDKFSPFNSLAPGRFEFNFK